MPRFVLRRGMSHEAEWNSRVVPESTTHEDDTVERSQLGAGAAALTVNFGFGPRGRTDGVAGEALATGRP